MDTGEPTRAQLDAEAAGFGENFTAVSSHPADLIADADEMLGAEEDMPDLLERGYRVGPRLVVCIRMLRDIIAPLLAEEGRKAEWSKTQTAAACVGSQVTILLQPLVRYVDVLSSASRCRKHVVPKADSKAEPLPSTSRDNQGSAPVRPPTRHQRHAGRCLHHQAAPCRHGRSSRIRLPTLQTVPMRVNKCHC